MMDKGLPQNIGGNRNTATELEILGIMPSYKEPGLTDDAAIGTSCSATPQAAQVDESQYRLVGLVRAGPSGTVASTAALQNVAHTDVIRIGPEIGSAGLLPSPPGENSTYALKSGSAMQDLLRAAEKALASGLGDWHLQVLQDISPKFQQHVLMGSLGPETLKHKHQLQEHQMLQLYALLHKHSTGFQVAVQQTLKGAQHMEQLLASVWIAFAQLWDECVQVFAAMEELQSTYATLLDTQDRLAAVEHENAALKQQCDEFVKKNLDHMLAWRSLKSKADALEGEVAMLSSSNSELSLRAAATNGRNTQLNLQVEGLTARLTAAEQQITDRESSLNNARIALVEKDSGLRRLEVHVAALQEQLIAMGQAARKQETVISDLQQQVEHKGLMVLDAERRVADKQRAYNLLHADFANKKVEAAEAIAKAEELAKRLVDMRQQVEKSQAILHKAEGWRQRWEVCQMALEDLLAASTRATMCRHDLVSSYWPVMERLGEAEDAVAVLSKQICNLGHEPAVTLQPRDSKAADIKPSQQTGHGTDSVCRDADADATDNDQQGSSGVQPDPNLAAERQSHQQLVSSIEPLEVRQAVREIRSIKDSGGSVASVAAMEHVEQIVSGSSSALVDALKAELQQLQDSYLVLQEAYWAQKERLLALELEAGQLRSTSDKATAAATQATTALAASQEAADKQARMRTKLEADLVGCKSWIRELEKTEQAYLKAIRDQGALEDAAVAAQRQLEDCRAALAVAQADCKLAEAAAEAVDKENKRLLQQLAQELQRSGIVEQELQRLHKLEASSSRAVVAKLQAAKDQAAAELAVTKARLQSAEHDCAEAAREKHKLQESLQLVEQQGCTYKQQMQQCYNWLKEVIRKLEELECRVSLLNSSICEAEDKTGQTVEAAVEKAVHLLERLLVTLQCLAADAGTISNIASAAKVEVLVRNFMQGMEAAAITHAGHGQVQAAAALTMLRNAAASTDKLRLQDSQKQISASELQLAETTSQLGSALSAVARTQRALMLKTRAVASLERQNLALMSELQQLRAVQASNELGLAQMQHELTEAKWDCAQAVSAATVQASELQAAEGRAAAAEDKVQHLQHLVDEATQRYAECTQHMQKAVAASRDNALQARQAACAASAAGLQLEQLQTRLVAAEERCAKLQVEVQESRQRAEISVQSARDAHYREVQTTTLLADARRALEGTKQLLQSAEEAKSSQQTEGGKALDGSKVQAST